MNIIPQKIYLNADETEQKKRKGVHARILINFIIVTFKCLSIFSMLLFSQIFYSTSYKMSVIFIISLNRF